MTYVTTGEAASMLGVGLNTIKRWIANGYLQGIRTPGGHWRIPDPVLRNFMQEYGMLKPTGDKEHPVRVLIIDDALALCSLLTAVLAEAEFSSEVRCAHDGYTGLIQIGSWRPDVLVLDILMPGINGLDVLHRLRDDHELLGDIAIVVVTSAFDRPDVMRAVREAKPHAVLPKPVGAQEFLAAIRQCLISATTVSPNANVKSHESG